MKMIFCGIPAIAVWMLISCANVKPYEREYLADPIMESKSSLTKQTLEEKFFSTAEGSKGCESGIAGGCGCAK